MTTTSPSDSKVTSRRGDLTVTRTQCDNFRGGLEDLYY